MHIQPAAVIFDASGPAQRRTGSTPAVRPTQTSTPGLEEVRAATHEIQKFVDNFMTALRFSIDDHSGRVIVSVVDTNTQKLVRQIPSAEVIQIARTLDHVQGLLFNTKA
jgi:flagellar protein FlaG